MRLRRPLPPSVLLVAVILLVVIHLFAPGAVLVPYPANLLGLLFLVAGVSLNLAADRQLKRHNTTVKPFQESAALVTTGVYARTRHPMYLGFVFIVFGIALALGSAGPFLIAALLPVILNLGYIRHEEAMLGRRFGRDWAAYQARVRKWC